MVRSKEHQWLLVGPWYRWARPGLPADGRLSAPEIQKYAHGRFVQSFMTEPQRSLMFDAKRDYVRRASYVNPQAGLVRRISGFVEAAKEYAGQKAQSRVLFRSKQLIDARMVSTGLLKLYQPVHERFYLVVAELHCETGGFPSPNAGGVCSAGFVVRRRRAEIQSKDTSELNSLISDVNERRINFAEIKGETEIKTGPSQARRLNIEALKASGAYAAEFETRRVALAQAQSSIKDWQAAKGYATQVDRWVGLDLHDPAAKAGEWRSIPQGQERLLSDPDARWREHVIPMHRAFADPKNREHDATGRAIYFGVIPATALQHDSTGEDRFNSDDVYEIHCFVRKRKENCERLPGAQTCAGELIWSAPTRPYCLAPALDLEGMANRPVTIKMPDIHTLRAQIATSTTPGEFASLGFDQPQQLLPASDDMPPEKGQVKEGAVCFFAIPLVTIVALFLLNLFLPIILFVFQLWWMLALKFCVPLTINITPELTAALDASPPDIAVMDDALKNFEPKISNLGPDDKKNLLNAVRQNQPGRQPGSLPPSGRTGRYVESAFYPHVKPVWVPAPEVIPGAQS